MPGYRPVHPPSPPEPVEEFPPIGGVTEEGMNRAKLETFTIAQLLDFAAEAGFIVSSGPKATIIDEIIEQGGQA